MQTLINKALKLEIVRFGIVGIIATGVHYGAYLLLKQFIGLNISYTTGYLISLICNFYLTAKFTFKTDTSVKKSIGFIASHVVNYLLHIFLLNIFIKIGMSSTLAPIPVYCIAIPVNFILVRTVFRNL